MPAKIQIHRKKNICKDLGHKRQRKGVEDGPHQRGLRSNVGEKHLGEATSNTQAGVIWWLGHKYIGV